MSQTNDQEKITCATEARELSEMNSISYDKVLNFINGQAQSGQTCVRYMDISISAETQQRLMNAGFLIGKATGIMGERITIISWA